jgi:hypothetical protein
MRLRKWGIWNVVILGAFAPLLLGTSCPASPGVVPFGGSLGGSDTGGGGVTGPRSVLFLFRNTTEQTVQVALFASEVANLTTDGLYVTENQVPIAGEVTTELEAGATVTVCRTCIGSQSIGAAVDLDADNILPTPAARVEPPRYIDLQFQCGDLVEFTISTDADTGELRLGNPTITRGGANNCVPTDAGSTGGLVDLVMLNATNRTIRFAVYATTNAAAANLFLASNLQLELAIAAPGGGPQVLTLTCAEAQFVGVRVAEATGNPATNPEAQAGPLGQGSQFQCGDRLEFQVEVVPNAADEQSDLRLIVTRVPGGAG